MSSLISRSSLFDDFIKDFTPGFFIKPLQGETLPSPGQIRMDVKESGEAYTIEAEVPGIDKEAIHVTVDGNTVTVKAECKQEQTDVAGRHQQPAGQGTLRQGAADPDAAQNIALCQQGTDDPMKNRRRSGGFEARRAARWRSGHLRVLS